MKTSATTSSGITGRPRTEDVLVNIEDLQRQIISEYPMKALREAITNAVVHDDWFIEKAGTGVKRMRDKAREGGYPEPVWEANGFTTTLFRPSPEVRAAAAGPPGPPGPSRDQVGTKSRSSASARKSNRSRP